MKNIIVVGAGEVGSAIIKLEKEQNNDITILDEKLPSPETIPNEIDIMHICIPFIRNFIHIVSEYIIKYKPKLTIINSTVKPGTTELIKELVKLPVVHSPIRGLHPNLYEGVKTFVKYIGGTKEDCELAKNHFESFGIRIDSMTSKETEFLKLLDTTYYGWNIAFANYVNKLCKENGLDYNNVYTKANQSYNEGYSKLGKTNVIRPVLYAPENGIGAHCISSNAIILYEFAPNLCNEVLKVGKNSKDPLNDKDWLFCEYKIKNRKALDIAKEMKVTKQNILDRIEKFKITK